MCIFVAVLVKNFSGPLTMRILACALLFLALICCVAAATPMEDMTDDMQLQASAAATKHKHKHSGFAPAECPGACQFRCSKTQYKKPCLFYCQKCCTMCRCVPPGTYGHKEVCPCYNNMKTKRGGPKCP